MCTLVRMSAPSSTRRGPSRLSGATLLLHPERGDTVRYTPVFSDAFEGSGVLVQFQRDARGMIVAADVSAGERARRIRFTRQVR
jgi:hypothetical protein